MSMVKPEDVQAKYVTFNCLVTSVVQVVIGIIDQSSLFFP